MAFVVMGFKEPKIKHIWKILSGALLLGNIEFDTFVEKVTNMDYVKIRDSDHQCLKSSLCFSLCFFLFLFPFFFFLFSFFFFLFFFFSFFFFMSKNDIIVVNLVQAKQKLRATSCKLWHLYLNLTIGLKSK